MIGIDIETYSSVDLTKSGVYAYTDAPDFQILLIGFKLDDNEPDLIDISGMTADQAVSYMQTVYPDFWDAFVDKGVLKTAYNANFERTCLSKYLGIKCPPEEWQCTMVLASTLGLPRSLAEVGAALGLEADKQKDRIGKSLIDYFCKPCKPTKTNGGRTRNLPEHDREKWELFKGYCRQDVVAEQAILDRLKKYRVPRNEKALWDLDQRCNDHGIRVDVDFVEKIIQHDEISTAKLMDEARRLTGLDNPNSLTQLKLWLLSEYGISADSITKDTIPEIINQIKQKPNPEKGIRVLEIRQMLGKTSVKKYQAMDASVCHDGRLRGVLQFYGANRTGRWAGRIVQVHNLPQNKIEDIDLARELTASGDFETLETLFGSTAFVFSQLIRTAFVASDDLDFLHSVLNLLCKGDK